MTPILPIEQLRQVVSYNPFHFWGLSNSSVPIKSNCNGLVTEYAWQNTDAAGRADLRDAIERSERLIREQLGYSVAPHFVEETVSWPRYADLELQNSSYAGPTGAWLAVRASEGKVISAGPELLTLVAANVPITLKDYDGDTVTDGFEFTAPVATTVTDLSQLAVYFSAADRWSDPAIGAQWRIAPVLFSLSGGNAQVKGLSWTIVKPISYQGMNNAPKDPTNAAVYVTTVDLYQRSVNVTGITQDTAQAVLVWETRPFPWFCISAAPPSVANSADPAAVGYALARVGIRDAESGLLSVGEAVWDAGSSQWLSQNLATNLRPPSKVILRYFAGENWDSPATQNMSTFWRVAVARFAIAEAVHRISACDNANREITRWQTDVSKAAGLGIEQFKLSNSDLNNPFGMRAGQVEAWRAVNTRRIQLGVSA